MNTPPGSQVGKLKTTCKSAIGPRGDLNNGPSACFIG